MDIILIMKVLVIADIMLVFTYTAHSTQLGLDLCLILNIIVVVTDTELVDGD